MDMPAAIREALAAADEDYLIGLCNKGTYNRAKKDLAAKENTISAQVRDETVRVDCGEAQCDICVPLGKSTCTCPSGTMCRHRITSILWLKADAGASAAAEAAPRGSTGGPEETETAEPAAPAMEKTTVGGLTEEPAGTAAKPDSAPAAKKFGALLACPADKLCRQLGARKMAAMLFRIRTEGLPEMKETSVVTVELPWVPATVRLLEPLEYATCSCHKTGLCDHKAEALLAFQLAHGVVTPEQLEPEKKADGGPDSETAAGACAAVRQLLAGQLATGLSRMAPSAPDTMERMAALCHVAQLPSLEKRLRAIGGEYTAYFARSATFRDDELLRRIADCSLLAARMEQAENATVLRRLAGSFHAEYLETGTLALYLIGMRAFSGRSGFAGTIYYFWETRAGRYYTYTVARPTFYDTKRRAPSAVQAAPWGLACSMESLCGMTLTLENARATADGRLSAASQSHAVPGEDCNAGRIMPADAVYTDFAALLAEKAVADAPEVKRVACVRAARCSVPDYDAVRQTFSLILYDAVGRDLFVEVRYSKEEKQVMRVLERLAARLKSRPGDVPVFFGSLYAEDEKLKMYPIEFYTDWEAAQ